MFGKGTNAQMDECMKESNGPYGPEGWRRKENRSKRGLVQDGLDELGGGAVIQEPGVTAAT